jgi:hypothetical protein
MKTNIQSILDKPIHLRSRKELQLVCHYYEVEDKEYTIQYINTLDGTKLLKLPKLEKI